MGTPRARASQYSRGIRCSAILGLYIGFTVYVSVPGLVASPGFDLVAAYGQRRQLARRGPVVVVLDAQTEHSGQGVSAGIGQGRPKPLRRMNVDGQRQRSRDPLPRLVEQRGGQTQLVTLPRLAGL